MYILPLLGGVVGLQSSVRAQDRAAEVTESTSSLAGARAGEFSPLISSAAVGTEGALAFADGGYDSARQTVVAGSVAEVRVWGSLALHVGIAYGDTAKRMQPSAGARIQFLRQSSQGVDASFGAVYSAEGFDETEGEIESTIAVGRRFQNFLLLGNLAYGQDPEGKERDGEVRASLLRYSGRATWGLEARGRSAIGTQRGPQSASEPRLDAVAGGIAMVSVRSFVLFGELGPAMTRFENSGTLWGLASIGDVGSVF